MQGNWQVNFYICMTVTLNELQEVYVLVAAKQTAFSTTNTKVYITVNIYLNMFLITLLNAKRKKYGNNLHLPYLFNGTCFPVTISTTLNSLVQ